MERRVLLCPTCGSSDLVWEAGMILGQLYRCKDCGYVGPLAIEPDSDEP